MIIVEIGSDICEGFSGIVVLSASSNAIANSQQVLPLAKVALEAHAFGDLKRRDDTSLDLLPALSGHPRSRSRTALRP
jgi:hypothetical protein